MNHSNIKAEEFEILSNTDFVVPLKQVGVITRAVLEGVHQFYFPRRIVIVTSKSEIEILKVLLPYWNVGRVECISEEDFFISNYNLSINDIYNEYDTNRIGDTREFGWWYQQLIKLGASTQIPGISKVYIVWDGDLVPIRRWKLCDVDAKTGEVKYYIAILQSESRSEFNVTQYANCMRELTGMTPVDPINGGTFVAHHMVFHVNHVRELLDIIEEKSSLLKPWPLIIMSKSKIFYRFSEYKTYATYMMRYHQNKFNYHELELFGKGSLRFREAEKIVEEIMKFDRFTNGGFSYVQLKKFVYNNWNKLVPENQTHIPSYIQLDHVYGLDLNDLRISQNALDVIISPF